MRSEASMPFVGELRRAYGDRVRIVETEHNGRPDLAELASMLDPRALVYCCVSRALSPRLTIDL